MQRDALLNKSRHLVGQLRRSTRTSGAWCRQRRKRAKVAVRERSDRTVPANPHHTRVFLLYTCLSPFINQKRSSWKNTAKSVLSASDLVKLSQVFLLFIKDFIKSICNHLLTIINVIYLLRYHGVTYGSVASGAAILCW